MVKGQTRGNREAKKAKKVRAPVPSQAELLKGKLLSTGILKKKV